MYSKQVHSNTSTNLPDVRVAVDKGSLRLQFSTKVSQSFYKKRQAYKGLGRSDTEKPKCQVCLSRLLVRFLNYLFAIPRMTSREQSTLRIHHIID